MWQMEDAVEIQRFAKSSSLWLHDVEGGSNRVSPVVEKVNIFQNDGWMTGFEGVVWSPSGLGFDTTGGERLTSLFCPSWVLLLDKDMTHRSSVFCFLTDGCNEATSACEVGGAL